MCKTTMIFTNNFRPSITAASPKVSLAAILLAAIIGCGDGSSQSSSDAPLPEPPSEMVAPPIAGDSAAFAPTATGTPPGTITLPEDFDPNNVPPPEPNGSDPATKNGGLKLPPIGDQSLAPRSDDFSEQASRYHFTSLLQAKEVSLQAATWDQIKQKATKTGKITVVDVWSLACEPCLKEFPGLVAIDREMSDKVACIAVDSDFDGRKTKPAESYRPRVEEFLKSVGATFPNFLCTTPSDELFEELEIESIPAVLIFDASGKLVRKFVDAGDDAGFTYHDNIVPFIKELLAQ
jgi:thiol-disulfide isomerase/thioredoxin